MPVQVIAACRLRGGSTTHDVSQEQKASPTPEGHNLLHVKLAISKDDVNTSSQLTDKGSRPRKTHSLAGDISYAGSSQQTECSSFNIGSQVNSSSVHNVERLEDGFFHPENLPCLKSSDKLVEEYDSAMNLLISNTFASYSVSQTRVESNKRNSMKSAPTTDCDDILCFELCPKLDSNTESVVKGTNVSQSSSSLLHECSIRSSNDVEALSRKTNSLDSSQTSIPDSCYISQDIGSTSSVSQTTRSSSVSSPLYMNTPLGTRNSVFITPIIGYEILEPRSRFTIYEINVQPESSDTKWSVYKRYNDFVQLNKKLLESFAGIRLSLPPKRWFQSNFDPAFLEERQIGLQSFLNNIMAHSILRQHPSVGEFLCISGADSSLWCSYQCNKCGNGRCFSSHSLLQQQQVKRLQEQLTLLSHHNAVLQKALSEECQLAEMNGLQSSPIHQRNKALLCK